MKAKIESIDLSHQTMTVEYFDPHGHKNIRLGMHIPEEYTEEAYLAAVRNNAPRLTFDEHHRHLQNIEDLDPNFVIRMSGYEYEFEPETFSDEVY